MTVMSVRNKGSFSEYLLLSVTMFTFDQLTTAVANFQFTAVDIKGTPCALINRELLPAAAKALKEQFGFTHFIDICSIDRFERKERFEITYNLRNPETKERIFLKVRCEERDPHIPSVTSIWSGANWNEREAYDMIGVIFTGHPDMRRMYLPEDFTYYPMRKDFPLMGVPGSIPLPVDEHLKTR